ncbi:sensor histidine kinase [Agromyces archimandritae]|uniref:ATP-binding protein n=1 Tax=Agromyces archimandritae TaxID=2781962 RepID=A0A975FN98_9MICO|nr:ATP-binding protein [Agromyces archimandritae]QTX05305.1 ATP-binding protein [Agromyces archimandritae]
MPAADWRMARFAPHRTAVSSAQVETVVARAVGIFGLVFAAQTVPVALEQSEALAVGAGTTLMALLYGGVVALAVASIGKVAVTGTAAAFAVLYAAALAAWPLLVDDPAALGGPPWLYYLANVATSAAAIAFPLAASVAYTVLVPAWYGVLRATAPGGQADTLLATLDALYAMILGFVVLIIITMLRQASRAVDGAQDAALRRYDVAARQHANEIERVRIDALVHDSVLTTLLSAAAAETPEEQRLAARMARDAVRRLDEAGASGPRTVESVGLTVLVRRIRAALTTFAAPFTVRVVNAAGVELTVEAIEAVYSATVQAMVNSLQHADEAGRTTRRELRVRGVGTGGVVVEVADNGRGFALQDVPNERLGLRVSIEERMAGAGGTAVVTSWPGEGTTVTIAWPAGVDGATT